MAHTYVNKPVSENAFSKISKSLYSRQETVYFGREPLSRIPRDGGRIRSRRPSRAREESATESGMAKDRMGDDPVVRSSDLQVHPDCALTPNRRIRTAVAINTTWRATMTKGDHMAANQKPGALRPAGPCPEGVLAAAARRGDSKAPV
ncbi:hypothetical protein J2808_001784 [Pseudarthrobacter sulfonivorans]|nr:hypothetical protein [Pseudarthrobacter sulfonivorans]